MPESLFGVALHPLAVCQQSATDTAAPIPVYYIHSFEQPFCQDAACLCQTHQQEVVGLFVSIIEGRVELEPVALLATGRKEPHV